MVVNQWHVIQAKQPNGFIDERLLKLLENWCICYIKQASKEPNETVVCLLRVNFCFSYYGSNPRLLQTHIEPKGQHMSCRPNPAQHRRNSLRVISVGATSLGHTLNFQAKPGTILEPVFCSLPKFSHLEERRGKKKHTGTTTRGLNTGVGFLFCLV